MDFRLSDDQLVLRRSLREFAERDIRPHVMEWDEAQHFPEELIPKLAELGLLGIQFPEEYGGAGMSPVDYCLCIEEISRVDGVNAALAERIYATLHGLEAPDSDSPGRAVQ